MRVLDEQYLRCVSAEDYAMMSNAEKDQTSGGNDQPAGDSDQATGDSNQAAGDDNQANSDQSSDYSGGY